MLIHPTVERLRALKRAGRLFGDLTQARGEGRLPRLLTALERVRLLIIDDWGPSRSTPSSAAICSRSSTTATTGARC